MTEMGAPVVTTLAQRKAAEAARRRRSAETIVDALRLYACRENGTFVVFGSYVTGTMRFDSDLDVLIDFPSERAAAAWSFVEDVCAEHHVPPDIHDARTSRSAFMQRVRAKGLALP
jgi:predicted nucleotidyltransferase